MSWFVENSLESIAANAKSVPFIRFRSFIYPSTNENIEQNHIVCVCVWPVAAGLLAIILRDGRYEYVCSSTTQYTQIEHSLITEVEVDMTTNPHTQPARPTSTLNSIQSGLYFWENGNFVIIIHIFGCCFMHMSETIAAAKSKIDAKRNWFPKSFYVMINSINFWIEYVRRRAPTKNDLTHTHQRTKKKNYHSG